MSQPRKIIKPLTRKARRAKPEGRTMNETQNMLEDRARLIMRSAIRFHASGLAWHSSRLLDLAARAHALGEASNDARILLEKVVERLDNTLAAGS